MAFAGAGEALARGPAAPARLPDRCRLRGFGTDADALRSDPALKVAVGRGPVSAPDLASQPTLSRLEQTVSEAECAAMNEVLLWHFLQMPRRHPREVILGHGFQ